MDILDLRSWSPMSAMTRPSITMLPTAASIMRKSANDRDDLPAPVLPTIPIYNHITKKSLFEFLISCKSISPQERKS